MKEYCLKQLMDMLAMEKESAHNRQTHYANQVHAR